MTQKLKPEDTTLAEKEEVTKPASKWDALAKAIDESTDEELLLEKPSYQELLSELEKKDSEIEALKAKVEENWQKFLHEKADMQNLQMRNKREVEDAHKFGAIQVTKQILPIVDSLERCLEVKHPEMDDHALFKAMREGVELTLKMFLDTLAKCHVEQVNPVGKLFDPQLHEAMSIQEDANAEPNTVLAVLQKGYVLQGKMVRPALVVVNKS